VQIKNKSKKHENGTRTSRQEYKNSHRDVEKNNQTAEGDGHYNADDHYNYDGTAARSDEDIDEDAAELYYDEQDGDDIYYEGNEREIGKYQVHRPQRDCVDMLFFNDGEDDEDPSPKEIWYQKPSPESLMSTRGIEVRTDAEINEVVQERWLPHVHSRAWDAFAPESVVFSLLATIAASVPRGMDPVLNEVPERPLVPSTAASDGDVVEAAGSCKEGIKEERGEEEHPGCIEWLGTYAEDGYAEGYPALAVEKNGEPTQMYANRILAFVFAADESFGKLAKLGKKPLPMICRNKKCVNLAHVDI